MGVRVGARFIKGEKKLMIFLLYQNTTLHIVQNIISIVTDHLRDLRDPLRDFLEPFLDLRDLRLGASACLERRRAPPENDPFLDPLDLREP